MTRSSERHRRGFSLLEATMALVIIATMAAVAAPRYGHSIVRYRVKLAAERVAADLELAQRRARMTSAPCTVTFDPTSELYTISGAEDLKGGGTPYEVDLAATPYECDLGTAVFGAKNFVTFDGYGQPDSGGVVQVSSGSVSKQVDLDADTGRATVQ